MMLLDFSESEFIELPEPYSEWQKSVIEFIQDWQSNNEYIISRTSGSTGIPKEIRLSKTAMKMSAKMTIDFFGLKKGETSFLCLPVNFIASKMMIVRAILAKLKLYCVEPASKLNLSQFPKLDFVPMTPMQVENSFENLNKIKTLLIGGATPSENLRLNLMNLKSDIYESYGMTETITHIALRKISEEFFIVLNGIKIRKDLRGCLVIQTPYFSEEIITNDLVEINDEMKFKWLGRIDNVINSGGIKLIPEQIEQKLKPFILEEFIITSIPDETLGQKLILVIEGNHSNLDLESSNLKKFERPKEIHFIPKFPRTESGKIIRKEIPGLI